VRIESNQTTYIKDITLLKETLPILLFNTKENKIINLHASPLHNTFIFTSQSKDGLYEISAFNPDTEQEMSIIRTSASEEPFVEISPFFPIGLIWVENTETQTFTVRLFLLDNPEEITLFTIPSSVKTTYQWNKTDATFPLYISHGTSIDAYALGGNIQNIATISSSSTAWHIDEQKNHWELYGSTLRMLPQDISFALDRSDIKKILDINDKRIIAQTDEETVVITYDNRQLTDTTYLRGTQTWHEPRTDEWWIWSPWELWTVFKNGEVSSPTRPGIEMVRAQQLNEYGLILLQTSHDLYAFHPGIYISNQLLFSTSVITHTYVQPSQRTIYFLGTVGQQHGFYKLEY